MSKTELVVGTEVQYLPVTDRLLLVCSLMVSWIGVLLFPLTLIVEIPCIAALAFRNSPLTKWAIIASAWLVCSTLTVTSTAIGYFTGNAKYYIVAFSSPSNLDPDLRCYHIATDDGDFAPPYMGMANFANNFTIRSLYAWFGPVWNSYHGPYPTLETANDLIATNGVLVNDQAFLAGAVDVGTHTVQLSPQTINDLESGYFDFGDGSKKPSRKPQYATTIGIDCLIIKGHGFSWFNSYEPRISLIDIATGEVFATYWPNSPNLSW